jgi:pimeloyl-ACP methyl ester carboxylesterase
MEFEHVTFDLPHGTFHALQGGDPDGQPTLVLHGFPDHPPTGKPFLAELGRRGRHVVAPWLRGYAPRSVTIHLRRSLRRWGDGDNDGSGILGDAAPDGNSRTHPLLTPYPSSTP